MNDFMQWASLALMALGGAAVAAAVCGAIAGAIKWQGVRMTALVGGGALAGLVTGAAFGWPGPLTQAGTTARTPAAASAIWNLDVIQAHYPVAYQQIASILNDPARQGASASELREATSIPYSLLVAHQMQYVDQANAVDLVRLQIRQMTAIQANITLCKAAMSRDITPVDPEKVESPELARQDRELDRRVLLQTATSPVQTGDTADIQPTMTRLLRTAFAELSAPDKARLGPVLQANGTPSDDATWRADCRFWLDYASQIPRLAPGAQAALVRKMASTSAQAPDAS